MKKNSMFWLALCGALGVSCGVHERNAGELDGPSVEALALDERALRHFGLDDDFSLTSVGSRTDPKGASVGFHQLHYRGVPVINQRIGARVAPSGEVEFLGRPLSIDPMETTPSIDADEAKTLLLRSLESEGGGTALLSASEDSPTLAIWIETESRRKKNAPLRAVPNAVDFKVVKSGQRLVYWIIADVYDGRSRRRLMLVADAHSGELVSRAMVSRPTSPTDSRDVSENLRELGDHSLPDGYSLGHGHYKSNLILPNFPGPKGGVTLGERLLGHLQGTETLVVGSLDGKDIKETPGLPRPYTAPDADYIWGDDLEVSDEALFAEKAAVDVLHGMVVTRDMWRHVFGHEGFSGTNIAPFRAAVHVSDVVVSSSGLPFDIARGNAWSEGGWIFFGDGAETMGDPLASPTDVEIVGHELAHLMFQTKFPGHPYLGETRGIEEANSDIIGTIAEFYASNYPLQPGASPPTTIPANGGDWVVGGNAPNAPGATDRHMDLPLKDFESFAAWEPGIGDTMDPHHMAGPINRMFYFLSRGVVSTDVIPRSPTRTTDFLPKGMAGIGLDKAARIWMHAITFTLVEEPKTFMELRFACESAARDLFEQGSEEERAVKNAFAAVNVGRPANDNAPGIAITKFGLWEGLVASVVTQDDDGPALTDVKIMLLPNAGPQSSISAHFLDGGGNIFIGDTTWNLVRVQVDARDNDGNKAQKVVFWDHAPPTIGSITHIEPFTFSQLKRFSVPVSDTYTIDRLRVFIDGAEFQPDFIEPPFVTSTPQSACDFIDECDQPWPLPKNHVFEFDVDFESATHGSHNVTAVAYDTDGNVSETRSASIFVDHRAPTAMLRTEGNTGTAELIALLQDETQLYGASFEFEGVSMCSYGYSNKATTEARCAVDTSNLADGTYVWTVQATDDYGNISVHQSTLRVNHPPEPPPPPQTYNEVEPNDVTPNRVSTATDRIRGNYDPVWSPFWGFHDRDNFIVTVPAGKILRVETDAYCSNSATLYLSNDDGVPVSEGSMNQSLSLWVTNGHGQAVDYEISVYVFPAPMQGCPGDYILHVDID